MYYHAQMTVIGTTVTAHLDGQLDGKPMSYRVLPGARMQLTFDAVEHPVWGKGKYGFTYTTTYLDDEGKPLGRFTETYLLPDDMIAAVHKDLYTKL